ncbi:uncharacterized protein LOC111080125 [Drosophila obscura]|uniref:uncharacterized protein LOC111080125 n=1 Tax=Drosophila obscura TaxID=7282 RepID=UPI001BB21A55|nr:uncharacterized protein LOC111080125 [Drosophila obscura]
MHRIMMVHNLCYFARKYLQIGYPGCDYYSIWDFTTLTTTASSLWQLFTDALDAHLPLAIWYMLGVSIWGLVHTCNQVFGSSDLSKIRWPRTHWVDLSDRMQHRLWLASNWLMIPAWTCLLYAIVCRQPDFSYPWLIIYGAILLIDILFLARARWGIRFGILASYVWPLFNVLCVNSLRIGAEALEH